MIETILVLGFIVACVIWCVHRIWRWHLRSVARHHHNQLEILESRYCRGEIDRDEYLQKRGDILGFPLIS
jgi:uncharacterized membrane protein